MHKPFCQPSENNKRAILDVLQQVFDDRSQVLEIGSGTGQHAVFFASELSHLSWQPTDRLDKLAGIALWMEEFMSSNLLRPLELDVRQEIWPVGFDAVFSANTLHIMPWELVQKMLSNVGALLPLEGKLALYGPFNYGGDYTSEGNRNFDRQLKSSNPLQGIRNFEAVDNCAQRSGLELIDDFTMPLNNRLLVWSKQAV